ncbi:MAG: MarC family protein [Chloroflexi bacterium]|nr:MarC family protein [Chloroflexota bacterium]
MVVSFFLDAGLAFVPLFVAIDPIGVVPIMLGFFGEATSRERGRAVNIAVFTAAAVGLLFLFLGRFILRVLSISVDHFAVAGGVILLALAMRELLSSRPPEVPPKEEMVEVVPIGTPLLAGPATITTLLVLIALYGIGPVLLAFAANLVVAWAILRQSAVLGVFLGKGGLAATAKVTYLLLAAIAVRLIVQGVQHLFF